MKLRTQKVTISLLSGLICMTLFVSTILYIQKWQDSILPQQTHYKINNSNIQAQLEPKLNQIVSSAKQNHETRSNLLKNISNLLSEYDVIDIYSVRLGFDKNLIVSANVQKPILAIHTQTKDVYIVGSGKKIIAKNPSISIVQSVPNIFLPDTKIENKYDTHIDFSWFLDQVNLINENYQWYNATINKVIWTRPEGFILNFTSNNSIDSVNTQSSPLTVYLGHKDLEKKIGKFKNMALILKQKNLNPHEIDLDLLDRAFIK